MRQQTFMSASMGSFRHKRCPNNTTNETNKWSDSDESNWIDAVSEFTGVFPCVCRFTKQLSLAYHIHLIRLHTDWCYYGLRTSSLDCGLIFYSETNILVTGQIAIYRVLDHTMQWPVFLLAIILIFHFYLIEVLN